MTSDRRTPVPPIRWSIDAPHSSVTFAARHMMIANVRGEFQKLSGEVTFDRERPEASRIDVTIDVASINTRDAARDAHLRSRDFLDAVAYPTITFASETVKHARHGFEVRGGLTIRGETQNVVLVVDEITAEHVDPWGNRRMGTAARAVIRRSDFGMTWNTILDAGGFLIGDEIAVQIEVELIQHA